MPDTHAFIWYHAEASIQPQLIDWIAQVERQLGVRGQLFRRQTDDKTTFMEVYDSVESATLAQIEELAEQQPWFTMLQSPRRAESFDRIADRVTMND